MSSKVIMISFKSYEFIDNLWALKYYWSMITRNC